MSVTDFEKNKQQQLAQRKTSLERLEKAIAETTQGAKGKNANRNEDVTMAYSSALAAVTRLAECDSNDFNLAIDNADTALKRAFERLEGIGEVDLSSDD